MTVLTRILPLLVAAQLACAKDRVAPLAPRISADVQMISLAMPVASSVIARLRRGDSSPAALAQIQTLVAERKAELIAWPHLDAETGGDAISSSSSQCIYPDDHIIRSAPSPWRLEDVEAAEEYVATKVRYANPWQVAVPEGFTSRSLGPSISLSSISYLSASGTVELTIDAQLTTLLGWFVPINVAKPARAGLVRPNFSTLKVDSTLTMASGETRLIGTFFPAKPHPHAVLFLLHVTIAK